MKKGEFIYIVQSNSFGNIELIVRIKNSKLECLPACRP